MPLSHRPLAGEARVTLACLAAMAALLGPAPPADSLQVRDIPVTVVADPGYRSLGGWRSLARATVERASRTLQPLIGIRFTLREEIEWDRPGDPLALERMLAEGHAAFGGQDGVIAVFAGPRNADPGDLVTMGHAYLGNQTLVVAPRHSEKYIAGYRIEDDLVRTFLHEFGHVLGVPHLKGRNIMSGRWDEVTGDFNELSLDVLRANRFMRFGGDEPFVNCDLDVLRDVYLFWDDRGEGEPALLVNLGIALLREGRPNDARAPFERVLASRAVAGSARLGLSRCALAEGDTLLARGFAAEASADTTLRADLLGALGNQWLAMEDTLQADRMFTRSIAADSLRFTPWYNRGVTRYRQNRFAEAVVDLRRALDLEERPEAWFNLGLALESDKKTEDSAAAFERYLELVPEGPRAETARKHLKWLRSIRDPAADR
jgi:tetratricopeptide (TPR) repeat protein